MNIAIAHDHIGISVTPDDLEATLEWYSSKLGFSVEQRFENHGTTFVFIVNGNVKIEVFSGASNRNQKHPDNLLASLDPERLHHFCLAVDDLDAVLSQLRERDVQLIGGPMDVPVIGRRIAFITDNVGTVIEFSGPLT